MALDKKQLRLYPDVVPTLLRLSNVASLGIIANQSPGDPARLSAYGIRSYFEVFLTSAECGVSKADPRIFEMAEEFASSAVSTERDGPGIPWRRRITLSQGCAR